MTRPADAAIGAERGRPWRSALQRSPATSAGSVLAGTGLLVLAGLLPIWGTHLVAPQYPKGLTMWVYGGRADGDVGEINGLNHYIGMQPIDLASVPEVVLWPLLILGCGVLLAAAVFLRGWLGRLALAGLWIAPLGVLADIQRWLITYGTSLDPTSALRLDPFIPLVVGPTKVWNFVIWSYPGPSLGVLLLVAALATIGRRAMRPRPVMQAATTAAALVVLAVAVVLVVAPALRLDRAEARSTDRPAAAQLDLASLGATATPGSLVAVPAGTYRVRLVIDRPLTLVADGEVVLDGGGRGTVVTITAPDVVLRGFTVRGSGGQVEEAAGIKVLADRVTVEANVVEDAFTGIMVMRAADVQVLDNTVLGSGQVSAEADHATAPVAPGSDDPHAAHGTGAGPGGQGDGISLWNSARALIRGNRVEHVRDGIYLNYVDEALVDTNEILSSRYAVHAMFGSDITAFGNQIRENLSGLVFMYTRGLLVGRNTIVDHRSGLTGVGVVLKDVTGVALLENLIARNRTGLQAEGTGGGTGEARIVRNRIASNEVGVALQATSDIVFGSNAFEDNLTQVLALEPGVDRRNTWTEDYVGNAWSDYAGYDLAGDGFGDVPHRSGGNASALMARDRSLQALRTSPALHVLDLAQQVWDAGRPTVVVDPAPLTMPTEGLPSDQRAGAGGITALVGWAAAGVVLLGLATGGLRLLARPGGAGRRSQEGSR
jgi:nitrous oxidase accessory protein